MLFITHLSALRGVLSTETYDRNSPLSSTKVFALNGEKQSIEIELLLDAVECISSESQVTITLDRSAPVIAAVDRFINMDSSVAVCRENSENNCACEMPSSANPTIKFPWQLDECNSCVLLRNSGICNGMGARFDAETGITYNLYIQNKNVTSTSVLVGKLKKSKPYNPAAPTEGGVQYEHLSIRSITKPECMGCFSSTDRVTPLWGASACNTCAVHLRIFFFTVLMSTTISEIANTPETSLTVHFEVWIDGVIYATHTTQPLSMISNAGGLATTICWNSFLVQRVHLPSVGIHLPGADIHLPSVYMHLPGAGIHLPGAGIHLPGACIHLPGACIHLPGAGIHLPGAGINLPSVYGSTWRW